MEYNTQRPQLKISDYGRNIYKLIQYAKGIEDREQRTQMAQMIVDIMSREENEGKAADDDKRKYWVHLMILADWDLDVDVPYEITREDTVDFTPHRLVYSQGNMRYRHYGHVMEEMVKRAAEYEEGEERDALVESLAHAMKRDYLLWNRDTVEDDVINAQLDILSGGNLSVGPDFQYLEAKEYLKGCSDERIDSPKKKKKKKKKKKENK